MATNLNIQGVNTQKPELSYRMNPVNPLKALKYLYRKNESDYPTIDQLGTEYLKAVIRILGTEYLVNTPHLLRRMSYPVFTEKFNKILHSILSEHDAKLGILTTHTRRPVKSPLEILWNEHSGDLTRHHILPQSRGGVDQERNYLKLPEVHHVDFHRVFRQLTPIEQIAHIVLCFRNEYHFMIHDICNLLLSQDQNIFFSPNILGGEKKKIRYRKDVGNFADRKY